MISPFFKSDGKLFQTLVAAAAKVLSPKQLDVRSVNSQHPRVNGTQLSCCLMLRILLLLFFTWRKPLVAQKLKQGIHFWQYILLWPVIK